jgi:xanthine dehydrogenase YagS FAD-binding subunit
MQPLTMQPLRYARADGVKSAIVLATGDAGSSFLAGGTTKVDLLRLGVESADRLIDINDLPLTAVEELADGTIRIGALARMSDVARTPIIRDRFPAVSDALLLGASEQLRDMASMGGNLCQRVRCTYFRDGVSPCNKREPGTGCSALEGVNRGHAILGVSESCIATHPSDVAVPFVAFDAVVHTTGVEGERAIPIDDFYLLPGDTPQFEHPLAHGELITAIALPPSPLAGGSLYLKFRDRQSYEFALVSVCVALTVKDGVVADVRVALGGVGTRPWRARRAEDELRGAPASDESFIQAAAAELSLATPRPGNTFKVALAERAIVRALRHSLNGQSA